MSKQNSFVKVLAVIGIIFGLFWVPYILFSFLKGGTRYDLSVSLMLSFLVVFMSLPGLMSFYYGFYCLKNLNEKAIRGLTASYCLLFITVVGGYLKLPTMISESLTRGITYLLVTFVAIFFYIIIYKYLFRSNGFSVPPLNQSLSKPAIMVVAYFIFTVTDDFVEGIIKKSKEVTPGDPFLILGFLGAIIIAIIFYKIAIRVFARQELK